MGPNISSHSVCALPAKVGRNGFYGHRLYAAFSHMTDSDLICFLDQDNWLDPDHVASLVDAIATNGWDWPLRCGGSSIPAARFWRTTSRMVSVRGIGLPLTGSWIRTAIACGQTLRSVLQITGTAAGGRTACFTRP